jgi:hypothetical protein
VLRGEILIQNHCYRADEMAVMIDIAKEFGYRSHVPPRVGGLQGRRLLAREGICFATWADWWGFKMEASTASRPTPPSCMPPAPAPSSTPTTRTMTQRLNQEAAAALAAARRIGLKITEEEAIKPGSPPTRPKAIGIDDQTGIARGRQARRRRALERQSVQRLRPGRPGLHRRRPDLGPPRPALPAAVRLRTRHGDPLMSRFNLMAGAAAAALVFAASPAAAETIAIINARILTAGPQGTSVIENGTVVIKDGAIASVGSGNRAPSGARVIDAQGGVVSPGFFATGSSLGAVEVSAVGSDLGVTNPDSRPPSTSSTGSTRPRP